MQFTFKALDHTIFAPLYGLSDEALREKGVIPYMADGGGFPCRVTLEDAQVGDRVLLLNHVYLETHSPYRGRHAIFVRDGAVSKPFPPNEIPEMILKRPQSLRAFDRNDMMLEAVIADGEHVKNAIE
ncbi:MAG: DUF1203 domain-containing protein, partial [Emcibacter sp.]|nr:DUF1203 domain-containing protein [Emcibacter sp.]